MSNNSDKGTRNLNVPTLRFPEFEGEWECHILSELVTVPKERVSNADITKSNYISTENMLTNFEGVRSAEKIPSTDSVQSYLPNDILVSNIRPYLKKIWLSNKEGGCSTDIIIFRTNSNHNSSFLYYLLASDSFISYVMSSAKGVKMPRGDRNQMLKYITFTPKHNEQIKIVSFLHLIDSRISVQIKIIESLESLIKGLEKTLFEECIKTDKHVALKDISTIITRKNDYVSDYPVMMISAENGFINQSEKYSNDNAGSSLAKYTLLKKGELAYNRGSSKTKKYGSIFTLQLESALIPYVYHSFSLNTNICDADFYGYFLNSKLLDKELRKIVSSSARMDGLLNISKEDFFSIKVPNPCLKKQQKIAKGLNALHSKLQIEKSLLEQLNSQKRFLLSQMFI